MDPRWTMRLILHRSSPEEGLRDLQDLPVAERAALVRALIDHKRALKGT